MKNKKWWHYLLLIVLAILFFPFFCVFCIYRSVINYRKSKNSLWLLAILPLLFIGSAGFAGYVDAFSGKVPQKSAQTSKGSTDEIKKRIEANLAQSKQLAKTKASKKTKLKSEQEAKKKAKLEAESASKAKQETVKTTDDSTVLSKLITYTNQQSAGPTHNYYWNNGSANITGFDSMKAGDYHFSSDNQGRSATAQAVLTYSRYASDRGSRHGEPLDPPFWPSNPKIAITYSLTGKTYHGYMYNRSHSISDVLLGSDSYTSPYNFTTGTRPQNVGANQNGGMRAAEELAENYWKSHVNTSATIDYETTPLYNGSEKIPRGSIVDEKSSDGVLNVEIVVINDAEGLMVDYNSGSESSTVPSSSTSIDEPRVSTSVQVPASSQESVVTPPSVSDSDRTVYVTGGGSSPVYWYSEDHMSSRTNLSNVVIMTESQAIAAGKRLSEKD